MALDRERLRHLRERAEPYAAVGAFLGGFLWDAVTLVRIDRLADDLLLLAYLLALATLLVLERRVEDAPERWPRLAPRHGWLVYGSQFFFGGLFSAQLVFYFRSASWGPQLAFVAGLAGLFVANEFLYQAFRRTWLRLSLFWLVTFTFLLFFVPVVTGYPGTLLLFLVAAVLATGVAMAVVAAMFLPMPAEAARPILRKHLALFTALAVAMGVADRAGLIPPVPLAALEIGIFHGVDRRHEPTAGPDEDRRPVRWWLSYERPPWYLPLRDHDAVFHWSPGQKAYCFTALFAPTGMELKVFHVWERWTEQDGWNHADRIDVTSRSTLRGGAANGFRTWSEKSRLAVGPWRCRAVTEDGREIGRVSFRVEEAAAPPELVERPWD